MAALDDKWPCRLSTTKQVTHRTPGSSVSTFAQALLPLTRGKSDRVPTLSSIRQADCPDKQETRRYGGMGDLLTQRVAVAQSRV